MKKDGVIMSAILGVAIAAVAFTVIMAPPLDSAPDIMIRNDAIVEVQHADDLVGVLSLVQIFERSEPGVVQINVKRTDETQIDRRVGSGFVYDTRGHIITNEHVIKDAKEVIVTFLDGRSYVADVVGVDKDTDLAVIKVEASISSLHPLPMGDSSKLKVGEPIAAIGNPFGLSGSMTAGIVSQMGRLLPQASGFSIPDIIQTDAAINPGNSGGPLINMRGEVVGINTAIQSITGEFTGVGFAVPSDTVSKIVPVLITDGAYKHPWLGIRGVYIDPGYADVLNLNDTRGFLIISVIDGGPASKAGLRGADGSVESNGDTYMTGGDIIVSVDQEDGRKIEDILVHLQKEKAVGDTIQLGIMRDGGITEMLLVLEERPK